MDSTNPLKPPKPRAKLTLPEQKGVVIAASLCLVAMVAAHASESLLGQAFGPFADILIRLPLAGLCGTMGWAMGVLSARERILQQEAKTKAELLAEARAEEATSHG